MNAIFLVSLGIFIPFFGTSLGSACVFFLPNGQREKTKNTLSGFAAGVMLASLFWSLLTPALSEKGNLLAAALGFFLGMGVFLAFDRVLSLPLKHLSGKGKMILAVTLHNLPEGMAVGIAFAGVKEKVGISLAAAFLLSVGIALQNFPEGAIISAPLNALGNSKRKSFLCGCLSGAVEPLGALISLALTSFAKSLLPFILSFAAGAMLFVVSDELIPSLEGKEKSSGLWGICAGFLVMMCLDVIFS